MVCSGGRRSNPHFYNRKGFEIASLAGLARNDGSRGVIRKRRMFYGLELLAETAFREMSELFPNKDKTIDPNPV
jgi:hypothetical protein